MILLSFLTLVSLAQVQSSNFDYETCINIACSACGDGYDIYTVNTLGSILTSNDGSNLCFHIFAEPELHKSIEKGLVEKMARIEKANSDRKISGLVKIELYDVAYPSDSGSTINTWKQLFKKCSTQRLFIPMILNKKSVNRLIYTDVDVVFIQPISKMFKFFEKFNQDSKLLFGLVDEHVEQYGGGWYVNAARHPFPGHHGANAGLMMVDVERLSKVSDFKLVKHKEIGRGAKEFKMLPETGHKNYTYADILAPLQKHWGYKLTWGDQCLLNVLLATNPGKLLFLPCSFNYRPDHCFHGENCLTSPVAVHGNRRVFERLSGGPIINKLKLLVRQNATKFLDNTEISKLEDDEYQSFDFPVNLFAVLYKSVIEADSRHLILKNFKSNVFKYKQLQDGNVFSKWTHTYGHDQGTKIKDYCLKDSYKLWVQGLSSSYSTDNEIETGFYKNEL